MLLINLLIMVVSENVLNHHTALGSAQNTVQNLRWVDVGGRPDST